MVLPGYLLKSEIIHGEASEGVSMCIRSVYLEITCSWLLWVQILPGTLDFFMWGSYPANLWNVCGSSHVWNTVWRGIWGFPPPVKLESRHITCTVLVWNKTQPNKKSIYIIMLNLFQNTWVNMAKITHVCWRYPQWSSWVSYVDRPYSSSNITASSTCNGS